jgi:hypothetical protein
MSANITTTITAAVAAELGEDIVSQYGAAIAKISEAVQEREYNLIEELVEKAAEETGYTVDQIEGFVTDAGFEVRPKPEPVVEAAPEAVTDGDDDRLARIERQVEALVALANRHLGASL